jgi:hypothetical protein
MVKFAGVCLLALFAAAATSSVLAQAPTDSRPRKPSRAVTAAKGYGTHFQTSDRCVACHNGITTAAGEDVSIGAHWRTSMMANSSRDPYWMASVRREMIDHPAAASLIQDECSICHMPMMRYEAQLAGGEGDALAHLPPNPDRLSDRLAAEGVSCTVCHQITDANFGKRESFVGRFRIDETAKAGDRQVYGPFPIEKGRSGIMHSSSTFRPAEGKHVQASELCATCHTLYTKAVDRTGTVIGELPEQVPYLEWQHSDFKTTQSCQSCHMPVVKEALPITSVFGEPREGFSRHTFVGGNFFIQNILSRFRDDLATAATAEEMSAAATRTIAHLQADAARVNVQSIDVQADRLRAVVSVENLGGHKLPTAYPSRRAWLHVVVRDRTGTAIFESGAVAANGAIAGNDNDEDAARVEPHYTEITRPDQVQIYESIMADRDGRPTTGLLTALRYAKDNRILPRGFDKSTAQNDIAVIGGAEADPGFLGGSHTVRYTVATNDAAGPFRVEAELWYQPVAYRWAMNLKSYDAPEPRRFVRYYEQAAAASAVMLARAIDTSR